MQLVLLPEQETHTNARAPQATRAPIVEHSMLAIIIHAKTMQPVNLTATPMSAFAANSTRESTARHTQTPVTTDLA